jgi:hypothetical protein
MGTNSLHPRTWSSTPNFDGPQLALHCIKFDGTWRQIF